MKPRNYYKMKIVQTYLKIHILYKLPKIHKPNILMRSVISGIDSAPHKLAGTLAKILTPLLAPCI